MRVNSADYAAMKCDADTDLITVQQLCKMRSTQNFVFLTVWRKLLVLIERQQPIPRFLPKSLFNEAEWNAFDHATRTGIGRHLYAVVNAGLLPGVVALPKRGTLQYYQKS